MLNPNEAPKEFVTIKYTAACEGYAFIEEDYRRMACTQFQRNDGKATANWPYDSEGTPVEVGRAR